MNTKLFSVVTLVLIFALKPGIGQANKTDIEKQELTRLLHTFLAGASNNDAAAHEWFWSDQLIYTSSAGKRFGKAAIMVGLNAENDGDDTSDSELATVYTAEDIQIQLHDNSAVVAFRLLGREQGDDAKLLQYFNTGTFVKQDNHWQAVAWQATKIP